MSESPSLSFVIDKSVLKDIQKREGELLKMLASLDSLDSCEVDVSNKNEARKQISYTIEHAPEDICQLVFDSYMAYLKNLKASKP